MSIIRQEDELKGMPDKFLAQEMESPSGKYPPFLVFTELNRRKDLRERFAEQQAQAPTSTMAEEMVAEVSGIGQGMPPQMMPPMDMPMQGMPMQMMSGGGVVRGFNNGAVMNLGPQIRGTQRGGGIFGLSRIVEPGSPDEEEVFRRLNELQRARDAGLNTPEVIEQMQELSALIEPGTRPRPEEGFRSASARIFNLGPTVGRLLDASEERAKEEGSRRDELRRDLGVAVEQEATGEEDVIIPLTPRPQAAADTPPGPGAGAGTGTGLGLLPFANQQPTRSFEDYIDDVRSAFGEAPKPEYGDLDRFEAMFEELNPAPDPNVTRGRALMAIGQGLLGAPTFAEGLAAGAGGVGQIYGEDAAAQREYNKNRLAAQQALMETRDARARFASDRDFQQRRSEVTAATQMRRDDQTRDRYARADMADIINDRLVALDVALLGAGDDEKIAIQEEINRLNEELRSLRGSPVTRTLIATPAS